MQAGTRFRIFPQAYFIDGYAEPITIELPSPAGRIGPGPNDERMYTLLPFEKAEPYGVVGDRSGRERFYGPPYVGAVRSVAMPDERGHFDHIDVNDPAFVAAHAYACARLTLDIWERHLGAVPWHFAGAYDRLEILSIDGYDNGQCGYGYLELGANRERRGKSHPFALNFDVIAHEMGHLILFSRVGLPQRRPVSGEYRAFHEAMADLIAFVTAAHIGPVVESVLRATRGNLYVANELNRVVELSAQDQIRTLANGVKLYEFMAGWSDEHDLSLPLSGAFFDIFVEIYQMLLIEADLVPAWVLDLADSPQRMQAFEHPVQHAHDEAYLANPETMRDCFNRAIDHLAALLGAVWSSLDADAVTFDNVVRTTVLAERHLFGGRFLRAVSHSFAWRGLGEVEIGPLVGDWAERGHVASSRSFLPSGIVSLSQGNGLDRFRALRG